MTDATLQQLAAAYGTPTFVFDVDALQARVRAIQEVFGPDIKLCYSIKANPFLISAMRGLVGTLEVCSPGELEICRQQGVSPDMVLFSGVNKTKADVERAMDLGVTHFTCESPLHIHLGQVMSRGEKPVPPVVRMSCTCSSSAAWRITAWICSFSSGTSARCTTSHSFCARSVQSIGPLVSTRSPREHLSLTVMTAAVYFISIPPFGMSHGRRRSWRAGGRR